MRLLYRADGGHPIGTGHIFRAARILKTLASLCELRADLVVSEDPSAVKIARGAPVNLITHPTRIQPDAIKPLFAFDSISALHAREKYDLLAVDMLDTPPDAMEAAAGTGTPLITFDDRGEGRFHADAIINVLVEEPEPARLRPETRLREGGGYAVLDPLYERANGAGTGRNIAEVRRVFVAMGGADAAGLSVKVARALRPIRDLERVEFLCGPAFPHRAELEAALAGASWEHEILAGLPNLLDRYLWCDLAIVAGGLTMYEVCCVGTPALAVCQPIDHQFELAERLAAAGAMETVGYGQAVSVERITQAIRDLAENESARRRMIRQGPQMVDGRGTARVAQIFAETARKNDRR